MKILTVLTALFITASIVYAQWKPGDTLIDERDGQRYATVVIGDQVWMAENLNYGTMIPTTKAGYEMSNNNIVEKYCWNNDTTNCCGDEGVMKRGGFYEWREAMQYWDGQPQLPIQGICPKGWHIPSNDEWNTLFNSQGGASCYINLVAGGSSGFVALMTGYRCTMTGNFRTAAMTSDTRTYFWTSQQTDSENAPIIELGLSSIQAFSFRKSVGLCIRCIMDEPATGIEENINDNSELYPNPSSDVITIFGFSGDTEITNSLGEQVWSGTVVENQKIDVSTFKPGLYILKYKLRFIKFIKL